MTPSQTLERIPLVVASTSVRSYRWFGAFYGAFVLTLFAALLWQGSTAVRDGPNDLFLFFDGAWRMLQGQRPHVDYSSALGFVPQFMTAIGLRLAVAPGDAIALGNLLLTGAMLPLLWIAAYRRFPAALAFLVAVAITLLLTANCALNPSFSVTSYVELYNRQGHAFLLILLLVLFVPVREEVATRDWLGATTAAVSLALLFHIKLSYFMVGIVAVPVHLGLDRPHWSFVAVFSIAFAAILAAPALFGGMPLDRVLQDYGQLTRVQTVLGRWFYIRLYIFSLRSPALMEMVALSALIVLVAWPAERYRSLVPATKILFLLAAGVVLCGTNSHPANVPPEFLLGPLLAFEHLRRREARDGPLPVGGGAAKWIFLFLLPPVFLHNFARDAGSVVYSLRFHVQHAGALRPLLQFDSPQLRGLLCVDLPRPGQQLRKPEDFSCAYVDEMNEGIALLRRHTDASSRILSLDYSNPFAIALGTQPTRGDASWWHVGVTFTPEIHPPAEQVFATATHAIAPTRHPDSTQSVMHDRTRKALMDIYGEHLHSHFDEVESTRFWKLYARKPDNRRGVTSDKRRPD